LRAFFAARALQGKLVLPATPEEAAKIFVSSPARVRDAEAILQSEDRDLAGRVLQGEVSLTAATRSIKPVIELVRAFRRARPEESSWPASESALRPSHSTYSRNPSKAVGLTLGGLSSN
jgi:hypothetical protein